MRGARREAMVGLALAAGAMVTVPTPALASSRDYPAPGFPSANASCTAAVYDFGAHYGTTGGSFPSITHGELGPTTSGHATTDGPSAVGAFSSTLAHTSGAVWACF